MARETALAHRIGIGIDRCFGFAGHIAETFHEFRHLVAKHADHILGHQDLTVTGFRRTDPDGGDIDRLGNAAGNILDHALDHDGKGARFGDGNGILQDCLRLGIATATGAISAKRIHRLRLQTDMAHHRNPARDEETYRFRHFASAFDLYA